MSFFLLLLRWCWCWCCCCCCLLVQAIKIWWGFTRIEADGNQLRVEAVSDSDGTVFDTLTLVKSEGWAERHMQAMQKAQQQQDVVSQQRFGWRQWWRAWQWSRFRSASLQEE
jgi:hypothetical protein